MAWKRLMESPTAKWQRGKTGTRNETEWFCKQKIFKKETAYC